MRIIDNRPARRIGIAGAALALVVASTIGAAGAANASKRQPAPDETGGAARNTSVTKDEQRMLQDSLKKTKAKNVILLIGDGMGDSEITVARDYLHGAGGELPGIDALPVTGQYTTYSLYPDGHALAGKPDYVPDSAATGTAWATGTKSYDGAIGVDIHGDAQASLLELAKAKGLRTGNVSTAEIQDATPAVQLAHVASRGCYGPDSAACGDDALIAGGAGSITEQLLDTRPDVTLGGGAATFAQTAKAGEWEGLTLFEQAEDRGYQVVRDAASLAAVKRANQERPVLGLFADGNFPTRFLPTTATVGGSGASSGEVCQENPDALGEGLGLADLTEKAISLLNEKRAKQGFFLQVEGASIDKRDHAADACGQIGETADLDEAVQAALAFAKQDGDTLVIVTADHAHTSQIVDGATPGLGTTLTTPEGSPLRISYGTAAAGGSQQHTGAQLRIAAYGPGASNVLGLTDQTDTFFTIANALRLDTGARVDWPVKHGEGRGKPWNSRGSGR
ncbi:alkaline phosphatase [Agromyces archimandritae]|uniref:Alkaline phosphatase n=1 Tax=Agromyces archimandritae TaxID=2781962 RepID=A0A975FPL4_9MICO|nr:alkaline phosphatase [Agromyces archimandritae]QTX05684.1 alkaline phosphatase [Agromyces archimandritae]